ncbi:MAG: hypothetical protein ACPG5U_07770 [Planktomarina sp.]
MLKFLFGRKNAVTVKPTQREVITSLLDDLNAALEAMPEKAPITYDPATGRITLTLPEQMVDEALALPAPEAVEEAKAA